ncbi:hypothetical protein ACH4PR_54725 [Streptomyces mirabilis]|uniref:hypothetical protein n=1 Tax=Streptomyces mirabilis TaxID=68239 RepID=UPI0037BA8410
MIAVGLIATAGLLLELGVAGTFSALTYAGRVAGSTFLVSSLLEFVAAAATFDYWGKRRARYSGAAVLIGVLISLAFSLALLIVQVAGREYTKYVWFWATLLAWSSWALWKMSREQAWKGIPHPKGLAVGASISALLAVGNLAYSEVYRPYMSTANISLELSFGVPHLSPDKKIMYLPLHIHYSNRSAINVNFLGTAYWVYGSDSKFSDTPRVLKDWKRDVSDSGDRYDMSRYNTSVDTQLIGSGQFFVPGNEMGPGDTFTEDKIIEIPANSKYEVISTSAQILFMRADRGTLDYLYPKSRTLSWDPNSPNLRHERDAPLWVADAGDEYLKFQAKIRHSSEVLNLTREPRNVTVWWVIPNLSNHPHNGIDNSPYMMATISAPNSEARELSHSDYDRLFDRYGVLYQESGTVRQPYAALLELARR